MPCGSHGIACSGKNSESTAPPPNGSRLRGLRAFKKREPGSREDDIGCEDDRDLKERGRAVTRRPELDTTRQVRPFVVPTLCRGVVDLLLFCIFDAVALRAEVNRPGPYPSPI